MQCQSPGNHPDIPSNRAGGVGACLMCQRERGARHRDTNRAARTLYRELADRGVPPDAARLTAGHRLLVALDLAGDVVIG